MFINPLLLFYCLQFDDFLRNLYFIGGASCRNEIKSLKISVRAEGRTRTSRIWSRCANWWTIKFRYKYEPIGSLDILRTLCVMKMKVPYELHRNSKTYKKYKTWKCKQNCSVTFGQSVCNHLKHIQIIIVSARTWQQFALFFMLRFSAH